MALKRTKRTASESKSQLGLFRNEPDHTPTSGPGNESKNHKSAEEIKAHNDLAASQHPYVLKYHCTRKPHFDFRLGYIGLMKSWAMDIMPSYYPGHRRKATQVEDHLREHIAFEGVFAEGTPGAGPTMVLDLEKWEPLPEYLNVDASLSNGYLKFRLHGKILKGLWTLTRQEEVPRSGASPIWYLTKEPDSFAVSEEQANTMFKEEPVSSLSKRTIKEVEREWNEGKDKGEPEPTLFDIET